MLCYMLLYSRGGRRYKLREPYFRRQKLATAISFSSAKRLISIYGTTYFCQSLYSTIKFITSNNLSVQTNINILFLQNYISQTKYVFLEILKVSWSSDVSNVRKPRYVHPCYILLLSYKLIKAENKIFESIIMKLI